MRRAERSSRALTELNSELEQRVAERTEELQDALTQQRNLIAELAENAVRRRALPYTGWAGFNYDTALPRERAPSRPPVLARPELQADRRPAVRLPQGRPAARRHAAPLRQSRRRRPVEI